MASSRGVQAMQTRAGAGNIALGYMFSPDFDLSKRHIPQSIIASSAVLNFLRPTLEQLSLLYTTANPLVGHISAVDYSGSGKKGLVTDYATSQLLAEDLGLSLVSSLSPHEAHHMALLATLMAKEEPSLHTYDGIGVGRELTKVEDVMNKSELFGVYEKVNAKLAGSNYKRLDRAGRLLSLLDAFNYELATDYKPFEYYGHPEAEAVLVTFGSVEGTLAAQIADALSTKGRKIGAVNVRVYRPFLEDLFTNALPKSVRKISVLGQVLNESAVSDAADHSQLFTDVLAAVAFSVQHSGVVVGDIKYARDEVWTPKKMYLQLQQMQGHTPASETAPPADILGSTVSQYSFWDLDDSSLAKVPMDITKYACENLSENLSLRTGYDNLAQGGTVRSDIRVSSKPIDAPYSVTAARLTFVGDERLLNEFAVLDTVRNGGTVVIKLPGIKDQDAEKIDKRLPESFRASAASANINLFAFDPSASSKTAEDSEYEKALWHSSFVRLTQESFTEDQKKLFTGGEPETFSSLLEDLHGVLRHLPIPDSWKTKEEQSSISLSQDITPHSFVPFEKFQSETPTYLKSWMTAAKGLAFKEATGAKTSLRPDTGVKTATVHVSEHRRLTPETYDRNIFHIEFDLGDSGLKYNIGEALGIHAENDQTQVEEFIRWYGLNPEDIVEVPSREDARILENRTIYQSLMQNIDIFGRPPKRFYESLAEFADDDKERHELLALAGPEGAGEFQRRAETDTVTFADILLEFPSAHPSFHDIVRIVNPMKRREYSIASSQKVQPNSVSLLIVTVQWVDPKQRDRFGQATRYLDKLKLGAPVTVSVKPSVMKLPPTTTAPLIMAGLGTGLAPFRAFVQERAWQRQQGHDIGAVLLYMGARHQREEYLYGEEWEAYQDAGVITLLGRAFSRDQPQKVYIQDRMRQTMDDIRKAYLHETGSFYLCGPTWPVPDVTEVLQEAVEADAKERKVTKKVDSRKEIEKLKDESRFVLEVY